VSEELTAALAKALAGLPTRELAAATNRLIAAYRDQRRGVPVNPIMGSRVEVAAYAAYRMPATYAAVGAALRQAAGLMPEFAPRTLLDVGGGTGAATWAARDAFPSLTSLRIVDQVADALAFGAKLLPTATWERVVLTEHTELPEADLITCSYVLNELSDEAQPALVTELARRGTVVAVLEPGTPAGYERLLRARDTLIASGLRIVAPCPHQDACPLPKGRDWCHFAARLNRSALHRAVKEGADLSYEDEKYAYLVATALPSAPAAARVLRQPVYGKGMVTLRLCDPDGTAHPAVIAKSKGDLYKLARDVAWGDAWPPH
jgi:ribosomal protein RSM22 (predicted rRNA methylase)